MVLFVITPTIMRRASAPRATPHKATQVKPRNPAFPQPRGKPGFVSAQVFFLGGDPGTNPGGSWWCVTWLCSWGLFSQVYPGLGASFTSPAGNSDWHCAQESRSIDPTWVCSTRHHESDAETITPFTAQMEAADKASRAMSRQARCSPPDRGCGAHIFLRQSLDWGNESIRIFTRYSSVWSQY